VVKEVQIMGTKKNRINYRRADNGKFTTEEYARRHPNTTVRETDKISTNKKPKHK
jgi:hypothetical protein